MLFTKQVANNPRVALQRYLNQSKIKFFFFFQNLFKDKCRKKLEHKNATITSNGLKTFPAEDLRERHAGVLGLCAIVNAFPYDVPEFLPDILVLLGDHLNDPQPISVINFIYWLINSSWLFWSAFITSILKLTFYIREKELNLKGFWNLSQNI